MMKAKQFSRLLVVALLAIGAATDALAQEYITDVMTIGIENGKGKKVRTEYENKGWTVVNSDLNSGAGGWDVYIAYKTKESSTVNPVDSFVTNICACNKRVDEFWFQGRRYIRAQNNSDYNGYDFNGDLNRDCGSGTADIFIYFTRDRYGLGSYGGSKRVITKLSVNSQQEDGDPTTAAIS